MEDHEVVDFDEVYKYLDSHSPGLNHTQLMNSTERVLEIISSINEYTIKFGPISTSVSKSALKSHTKSISGVYINYGVSLFHPKGLHITIPFGSYCEDGFIRMEAERVTNIVIRSLEVKAIVLFCPKISAMHQAIDDYIDSNLEEATRLALIHRKLIDEAEMRKHKVDNLRALRVRKAAEALHNNSLAESGLDGLAIVRIWYYASIFKDDFKKLDRVLLGRLTEGNLNEIAEEFDEALKFEMLRNVIDS